MATYRVDDQAFPGGQNEYDLDVGSMCPLCGEAALSDTGDGMLCCEDGCGSYFNSEDGDA